MPVRTSCCAGTAAILRPLTDKFLDVSEYRGLGSLEFKWDAVTQRFLIIEPTVGRTDSQEEIATLSGVNLPLIAYRHQLGLPALPQRSTERPVAWFESYRHLKRWPSLPAGSRIYDAYWRIGDPMPALVFYADYLLRSGFRRFGSAKDGGRRRETDARARGRTFYDRSHGPFEQEGSL